ncbi:MAG: xanthine dehydrogenase family protein subunit M [Bacteroidales bacterium]|nr:xanthine dehydrogenase family protein subunit M [Bacteroidales bacterium]
MAIPYEFGYQKPATLQEAIALLAEHDKNARILAGGTDLVNELKQGFRVPEILIDIKGITELKNIQLVDDQLEIGALVTFSEILHSKILHDNAYILFEAAGLVASNGVRNRATMVGNICSAVACMDSASPLLVHDAVIHLISSQGERNVPIQKWFDDNRKTTIRPNELVTHVSIPIPKVKYAGAYQKMMRYSGEDLSQANVGVLLFADNTVHVAFGSVGPIPKRSPKIENLLKAKGLSADTIEEAKQMIEKVIAPITDVRASKEYRLHMCKVMFVRALNTAQARIKKPKLITK